MGLNENGAPGAAILRNPQGPNGFFRTFCFWCLCCFCGFFILLILASLGERKYYDKIHMAVEDPFEVIDPTVIPPKKPTVIPPGRPTQKNTVPPANVPIKVTTRKTERPVCLTESCKRVVKQLKSQINETTPPCFFFFDHTCGTSNEPRFPSDLFDNFVGIAEISMEKVSNLLESDDSEVLATSSEKNLKKVYEKCLNREHRDVEDLMKTLTDDFGWPFEGIRENHIQIVNKILSKLIRLNPKALQLFNVIGLDGKLTITPNFCHGRHRHINVKILRRLFDIITENPKHDVKDQLEHSLEAALEINRLNEYCTEVEPPTDHKKPHDVDFDSAHIDFLQIFGNSTQSHMEFKDSYEMFQKEKHLNHILYMSSIKVAHYLVIKYMEDISMRLLFPVKEKCTQIVLSIMPETFLSVYYNRILHPENYRAKFEIAEKIQSEFLDRISKSKKFNKTTQEELIQKVEAFELDGNMAKIEESDSFYTAFGKVNTWNFEETLDKIEQENRRAPKSDWTFNLGNYEAVYKSYSKILSDPLPNPKLPLAIQYGRVGHQIAHQLAKILDKKPSVFTYPGEGRCNMEGLLVDMSYTVDLLSMKTTWKVYKTLNLENDVRLEGLENITDDQLFFYSMAQATCPKGAKEHFRTHNILKQVVGFRRSFKCKENKSIGNMESRNCDPL